LDTLQVTAIKAIMPQQLVVELVCIAREHEQLQLVQVLDITVKLKVQLQSVNQLVH